MKKAVIYTRVSTDEQASKGISLSAQESACRKKAEELGFKSIQVIEDGGYSAGTLNRPGLQKIIKMCENKEIDTIFAIHSDRISRNTENHLKLRRLFKENNVKLMLVLQSELDDNTAFGKTMDTVMASFNELQRLTIAEKTKNALHQKVEEGWFPGLAPLGYKNVDNPKFRKGEVSRRIIVPDPKTAPFVKKMFKLYATGNYNVYDLVDYLYKKGFRSRNGGKPAYSRIYETMKNPLYIGELHWDGIHIRKAKHKPLTDKWTFKRVRSVMSGHNHHACRQRKHNFLLRGFLYCGRCGKRLGAEWHFKKSGLKFSYYHCPQRYGCGRIDYIKTEELEKQVEKRFKEIQFTSGLISEVVKKSKSILEKRRAETISQKRGLYNQKKAVEAKRNALENKLLNGIVSDEEFTRMREKINDDLDTIQDQLDRMERTKELEIDELQEILGFARDIYKTYKNAPYAMKRHYLAFFWDRFEVRNKKIVKAKMTKLFEALVETGNAIQTEKVILEGSKGG